MAGADQIAKSLYHFMGSAWQFGPDWWERLWQDLLGSGWQQAGSDADWDLLVRRPPSGLCDDRWGPEWFEPSANPPDPRNMAISFLAGAGQLVSDGPPRPHYYVRFSLDNQHRDYTCWFRSLADPATGARVHLVARRQDSGATPDERQAFVERAPRWDIDPFTGRARGEPDLGIAVCAPSRGADWSGSGVVSAICITIPAPGQGGPIVASREESRAWYRVFGRGEKTPDGRTEGPALAAVSWAREGRATMPPGYPRDRIVIDPSLGEGRAESAAYQALDRSVLSAHVSEARRRALVDRILALLEMPYRMWR